MKKKYPSTPMASKGRRVRNALELDDDFVVRRRWASARDCVIGDPWTELVAKRHPSACVHHLSGAGGVKLPRRRWPPPASKTSSQGPSGGSTAGGRPKSWRGGRAGKQRSRQLPADWPRRNTYRPLPLGRYGTRSRLPAG